MKKVKKMNLFGKKVEFSHIWFVSVECRLLCRAVLNTCIFDLVPRVTNMGENCVFSILHTEFDINVTPKIKCILLKLGYSSFRTLARINPDCAELEHFVRTILADIDYVADLPEAERVSIFGEMFANIPSKFSFMPGEKALIADVVDTAQKITARSQENFSYDILPSSGRKRKRVSTFSSSESGRKKNNSADGLADMPVNGGLQEVSPTNVLPIDSVMRVVSRANVSEGQSDMTNVTLEGTLEETQNTTRVIRRKGKSLQEYLFNWISKSKLRDTWDLPSIKWTIDNHESEQPKITCSTCKIAPFNVNGDKHVGWKFSAYVNHINNFHKRKHGHDATSHGASPGTSGQNNPAQISQSQPNRLRSGASSSETVGSEPSNLPSNESQVFSNGQQ